MKVLVKNAEVSWERGEVRSFESFQKLLEWMRETRKMWLISFRKQSLIDEDAEECDFIISSYKD